MATAAGSEAASSGPDPGNRGSSDLGCAPAAATGAPTRPSSAWGTDPRGPGVPRLGERRLSLGHPTERSRSTWGSLVQCQTRALEEVAHIFSFPSNNPRTSPCRTPGLGGKKSLLTACPLKLHSLKLVLRWFLSGLGQPEPPTRGQRGTRITLPVAARDVKNLENQKRCPCGTTHGLGAPLLSPTLRSRHGPRGRSRFLLG